MYLLSNNVGTGNKRKQRHGVFPRSLKTTALGEFLLSAVVFSDRRTAKMAISRDRALYSKGG